MNLTFNNEVQRVLGTYRTPSLEKLILPEPQPVARGKNIDPNGRPCTWTKSTLALPEARIRYDHFEILDDGFVLDEEVVRITHLPSGMALAFGLERPPRNLDIFNWYSFTDIAKLIDNDVDMQFALQYKQANRNATADGCIKAYENQ